MHGIDQDADYEDILHDSAVCNKAWYICLRAVGCITALDTRYCWWRIAFSYVLRSTYQTAVFAGNTRYFLLLLLAHWKIPYMFWRSRRTHELEVLLRVMLT